MSRMELDIDKKRIEQLMQGLANDKTSLSAGDIIKRYNGVLTAARLLDNPLFKKYNEVFLAHADLVDPNGYGRKTIELVTHISHEAKKGEKG